ncbi:undecaprenyl-diphosphatase [Vibrio sp. CDRSL-10 TSBA]
MESFNHWLFLLINPSHQPSPALLELAKLCAELPVFLIPLCLALLWMRDKHSKTVAFNAGLTTVLALAVNYAISLVWYHNRPFVDHLGIKLISHASDSSFPSDHITLFASVAFYLCFEKSLRKLGLVLLALSLSTGWARVFVGVHYPFDILGGYLISALTALLFKQYLAAQFAGLVNLMMELSGHIAGWLVRMKKSAL